jgi:hypothetical protein
MFKNKNYSYNVNIDNQLEIVVGRKLNPNKSRTRANVELFEMSRPHFIVLTDIEKKLFARDILEDPEWRKDWDKVR